MPLTAGNVTIKLAGGDYSTWAAFWDDLGTPLTGNITCTVDASEFTETAAPAPATESLGGYTLHVLPATFPTTTDGATGPRFIHNHVGNFEVELEGAGTLIIEGIVHKAGTEWGQIYDFEAIAIAFTAHIRRNVFKGDGVTSDEGIKISDSTPILKIYNNILFDIKESAAFGAAIFTNQVVPAGSYIANNTLVDNTGNAIGCYVFDSDAVYADNNLCHLSSSADFYNVDISTGYNNSSYDATADDFGTGSDNRVEKTADPFTNYAADDFTLAVGSDPIGNGKDLSALFIDDFFGNTRVAWDIGAVEYQAEGGDISESMSALIEVKAEGIKKLSFPMSALIEVEAEGTKKLMFPLDATIEVEAFGTKHLTFPLNAILEVEADGTLTIVADISESMSATLEVRAAGTKKLTFPLDAIIETKAEGIKKLKFPLDALIEVEGEGTKKLKFPLDAILEVDADGTLTVVADISESMSATLEVGAAGTKRLKFPMSALIEVEAEGTKRIMFFSKNDVLINIWNEETQVN